MNGDPSAALPLNAEGIAACHRLHHTGSLSDARVWITSGFQRTQQTALLLAGATRAEFRSDPRLNELGYGDFEGGSFLDYATWLGRHGPWARPPGSAESQGEAFARMLAGVQGTLTRPGPRA
ncbi:histidine phosphatase family protein [Streptomyces sp. NBC_01803]|uniref:histidine phosphatase family protein n=1 Tax=Streptomyces sp. NBC_01803 TaxID=2975946 RepID=UPI002DDB2F4B|nr:histidine phosphatase family protein [Streptomyces sp. NBC_01803]WSA45119.1 phosphoglycerate mutase family protein [Streptomyces sp. NBC_01803]